MNKFLHVALLISLGVSLPALAGEDQTDGKELPQVACTDITATPLRFGYGVNVNVSDDAANWIAASHKDKHKPRVLINGRENANEAMDVVLIDSTRNCISINLQKTAITDVIWDTLRERSANLSNRHRRVTLSFADDNGRALIGETKVALPSHVVTIELVSKLSRNTFISILLVIVLLFLGLARRSDLLKDGVREGGIKCYSLAKTQMAFWFMIIAGAVVFVWLIQGQLYNLDTSALALLGISAVTFLGSKTIESNADVATRSKIETDAKDVADKLRDVGAQMAIAQTDEHKALTVKQKTLQDSLTKLEARQQMTRGKRSTGFLTDILFDHNGVQLHRFQMAAWTLIIGAVFVFEVIQNLQLPKLGPTILGLMGISSGTYLGFKFPSVGGDKG